MKKFKRDYSGKILLLLLVTIAGEVMVLAENKNTLPKATTRTENSKFNVTPPVMSRGFFPCSECHSDMSVNRRKRKLTQEHEDIVIKHDAKNRWCLDCHSPGNRNKLRLINGKLISFEESYKLCGQCHGLRFKDWKNGVHGKRTGFWNGEKKYYLCVSCHDPHDPKFKKIKPLPPPWEDRSRKRDKSGDGNNEKQ